MQHREKLVLEFWDRSDKLSIKDKNYNNFVKNFLYLLLKQDIENSDISTNSLTKNKNISSVIIAKESGIFAGLEEFKLINNSLKIKPLKNDGDKIKNEDILIEINGNAKKILSQERIFLNLLQRMSGIATLTNNLIKKLDNKVKLAATRKTLWGGIDKKAVSIGGGLTHRLNLNDGIIIKDNHLKVFDYDTRTKFGTTYGGIEKALKLAKNKSHYIEIEVENKKHAVTAAKVIKKLNNNKNSFAIMLDKIQPREIKLIIEELKNNDLYDYVLLEASGNINPNNLMKYADCGVDVISMGYITNSAKVLNMSLEITK